MLRTGVSDTRVCFRTGGSLLTFTGQGAVPPRVWHTGDVHRGAESPPFCFLNYFSC